MSSPELPPHIQAAVVDLSKNKALIESVERTAKTFQAQFDSLDLERIAQISISAAQAERISASMRPLAQKQAEIARRFAERFAPLIEAQAQLSNKADRLVSSMDLSEMVAAAIEVDSEESLAVACESEPDLVDQLLKDSDLAELVDPETRRLLDSLGPLQRRRAARIISFILNSIGAVALTLVGLPWLAALLGVVVSALTNELTERIDESDD